MATRLSAQREAQSANEKQSAQVASCCLRRGRDPTVYGAGLDSVVMVVLPLHELSNAVGGIVLEV